MASDSAFPDDAAPSYEQLLQDEQVFAEMEGVEDELFDAFVRKQLTERDAELFRAKYGHQVDRIAFARELAPRSEGVAAPRAARWNWPPVAIAATIMLAAGGYVLVRDTGRTAPAAADAVARETAAPAAPPTIALLRLGGTREAAAGGQRITLADDTPSLRLRVQLGPADRCDLYSLQLRSAAKAII